MSSRRVGLSWTAPHIGACGFHLIFASASHSSSLLANFSSLLFLRGVVFTFMFHVNKEL